MKVDVNRLLVYISRDYLSARRSVLFGVQAEHSDLWGFSLCTCITGVSEY